MGMPMAGQCEQLTVAGSTAALGFYFAQNGSHRRLCMVRAWFESPASFSLSAEDMVTISGLEDGYRLAIDVESVL